MDYTKFIIWNIISRLPSKHIAKGFDGLLTNQQRYLALVDPGTRFSPAYRRMLQSTKAPCLEDLNELPDLENLGVHATSPGVYAIVMVLNDFQPLLYIGSACGQQGLSGRLQNYKRREWLPPKVQSAMVGAKYAWSFKVICWIELSSQSDSRCVKAFLRVVETATAIGFSTFNPDSTVDLGHMALWGSDSDAYECEGLNMSCPLREALDSGPRTQYPRRPQATKTSELDDVGPCTARKKGSRVILSDAESEDELDDIIPLTARKKSNRIVLSDTESDTPSTRITKHSRFEAVTTGKSRGLKPRSRRSGAMHRSSRLDSEGDGEYVNNSSTEDDAMGEDDTDVGDDFSQAADEGGEADADDDMSTADSIDSGEQYENRTDSGLEDWHEEQTADDADDASDQSDDSDDNDRSGYEGLQAEAMDLYEYSQNMYGA